MRSKLMINLAQINLTMSEELQIGRNGPMHLSMRWITANLILRRYLGETII